MLGDLNLGIVRDVLIAGVVGLAVFFFSLTALANRPDRESIATYHLNHTREDIGIEDVVGAIVADYRGLDTVIEVMVFSTAALGVLTLLVRGYTTSNSFLPSRENVTAMGEFSEEAIEEVQDTTNLSTPFTRMVARLVLPLSFLLGLSHIVNGGHAPGDGFTAGTITGLATALWFVVFGYDEAKTRLALYAPQRLMRAGIILVVLNAFLPILFGLHGGTFLTHVDYGAMLGINDILHRFGLELTGALFFEIGIVLGVFGGFGAIMEAIAHPKEAVELDFDPSTTLEMQAITEEEGA
jgi:multisubunit Na+/H+ antiporter MnhB subunit